MIRSLFSTRWAIVSLGILTTVAVGAGAALALQGGGGFELDGNAVDDPGGGIDWANIYQSPTDQSFFAADASGPNADDVFTQGGSKDTNDVSQWHHTTGNVPDKDDLLDGYATAMSVNGNTMLYFGADRATNNGDAQIGLWLLSGDVAPQPDGSFSGAHTDNDLLVLSNFTDGGKSAHLQVFRWNGQSDPNNPLQLLAEASSDNASYACTQGDTACVYTNTGGESSPWPYTPKSGDAGSFPALSFFEGGVNLTSLLGSDAVGCDANFVFETRSSQEPSAELKDMLAGSVNLCGLTLSISGSPSSKIGDPANFTYSLQNIGVVPLTLQTVTSSLDGDVTSAASQAGCQTLAAGATCQFNVIHTVKSGDPDPLINDVTAAYQAGADSTTASASVETNLFQPSITFDNFADTFSVSVGDTVHYVLTLMNTSSSDSPNLSCTITDQALGVSESVNLAPGEQHVVKVDYTVKPGDVSPLVNTASAHCQVDGFPNVLDSSDDHQVAVGQAPSATTESIEPTATAPSTAESTEEPTAEITETVEPSLQATVTALAGEGCSPGFWQGGHGRYFWDQLNDPQWLGTGTNPFTHKVDFNSVFAPYPATADQDMYSFVRGGGGPNDWNKAARNVVAGYLNASYFPDYPFTPDEVKQMWADAVNGTRTFMDVHIILGAANELGCDL